jgi:ABC-type molybdate transport system substrate-binding protein
MNRVNLSSLAYKEQYQNARVVTMATDGGQVEQVGEPIIYTLSIPKNAANHLLAWEFARFFLGAEGQEIMLQAGQTPMNLIIYKDMDVSNSI